MKHLFSLLLVLPVTYYVFKLLKYFSKRIHSKSDQVQKDLEEIMSLSEAKTRAKLNTISEHDLMNINSVLSIRPSCAYCLQRDGIQILCQNGNVFCDDICQYEWNQNNQKKES